MAKISVTDCPAGPALDAAVAKVLGWTVVPPEMKDTEDLSYPRVYWFCHEDKEWLDFAHDEEDASVHRWSPSTDIAAAWELAEIGNISLVRIQHEGWVALPDSDMLDESELWEMNDGSISGYYERRLSSIIIAPAPLAITRAFLLAHGVIEVEVPR